MAVEGELHFQILVLPGAVKVKRETSKTDALERRLFVEYVEQLVHEQLISLEVAECQRFKCIRWVSFTQDRGESFQRLFAKFVMGIFNRLDYILL